MSGRDVVWLWCSGRAAQTNPDLEDVLQCAFSIFLCCPFCDWDVPLHYCVPQCFSRRAAVVFFILCRFPLRTLSLASKSASVRKPRLIHVHLAGDFLQR